MNFHDLKKIIKENYSLNKLHSQTSLTKEEIIQLSWLDQTLPLVKEGMYIGNVGIKYYIPSNYRYLVGVSRDVDLAVENVGIFPNAKKDKLIDKTKLTSCGYYVKFSPFEVYRVDIPLFQIGSYEFRELDVFDESTGIGAIPLEKEDFKKRNSLELGYYFYFAPLYLLLSTHLNPLAENKERIRRSLLSLVNELSEDDFELIERKFKDSADIIRKVGLNLLDYKQGFPKITHNLNLTYKQFTKSKKKIKLQHLQILEENVKRMDKILNKISTILPVV